VKFVKADVTAADTGPMDRLRRFGTGWTVLTASIALLIVYFAIGGLTGEIVWDVAVFGQLAIATAAACRFSCHRGAWLMVPIDIVKLDRSFMSGLDGDHGLLSGLIGLARSLDLETVVEGIEHEHQERIARDLGAEYGQGYRYAKPVSSSAFVELALGSTSVRPH
jgi:hypothetical protein